MGTVKRHPLNRMITGVVAGLIGPVFGYLIFYAIMFNHITLREYSLMMWRTGDVQAPLLAVCLIFNLVFFFAALRLDWIRAGQGVIMAMFIYAPVIIYLKYA